MESSESLDSGRVINDVLIGPPHDLDLEAQRPTMTTSVTEGLIPETENPSTEITAVNQWWYKAAFLIFLNAVISYGISVYFLNRPDGLERLGWAAQTISVNGNQREVYLPMYVQKKIYKQLEVGK